MWRRYTPSGKYLWLRLCLAPVSLPLHFLQASCQTSHSKRGRADRVSIIPITGVARCSVLLAWGTVWQHFRTLLCDLVIPRCQPPVSLQLNLCWRRPTPACVFLNQTGFIFNQYGSSTNVRKENFSLFFHVYITVVLNDTGDSCVGLISLLQSTTFYLSNSWQQESNT